MATDNDVNYDVPKGSLIVFSEGEYSDFGYRGHYVTLQDLNRTIFDECAAEASIPLNPSDQYSRYPDLETIMIRKGLLLCVDVRQFHLDRAWTSRELVIL